MREKGPERQKIRLMARTLEEKRQSVGNISKEVKILRSGVGEVGSDWHDTQALHGDVYVSHELMRIIGLPQGEIEIIAPREEVEEIGVGNTVVLRDTKGNALKITIGGEHDSDPLEGLFSCNSPIAKGALGKRRYETFRISSQEGEETFEIVEIKKGEF